MTVTSEPFLDSTTTDLVLSKLKWENKVLRGLILIFGCSAVFFGVRTVYGLAAPHHKHASVQNVGFLTTAAPQSQTLSFQPLLQDTVHLALGDIPEEFDARAEWPGCGTFVVDQGQCGDCWAASSANVLGDRACIHLLADGSAVPFAQHGAHGIGDKERMFQQAGKCIGQGTMNMAHPHGCQRGAFFVSPQALVSCGNVNITAPPTFNPYPKDSGYQEGNTLYPSSSGCNGGEAQDAWRFFYHEGLTVMFSTQMGGCTPYTSGLCSGFDPLNNGCRPCNFDQCDDTGLKPERVRVMTFGWIMETDMPARGHWEADESFTKNGTDKPRPESQRAAMDRQVKKIQKEIMTNGPVHSCIDVYTNFPTFWNDVPQGVYNSTEGSPLEGGHCIELMGWGTDHATGIPYWTWKNSWGVNFANGGYGRIIRGVDLLGVESDVWAACPHGADCELTEGVVRNETWVPDHAYHPEYAAAHAAKHPTSPMAPSRSWPGGKEVEMKRDAFMHPTIAPLVALAARHALGQPDISESEALAKTVRVWTRSVRGTRVRVEVEDGRGHTITRHMEGHVTL